MIQAVLACTARGQHPMSVPAQVASHQQEARKADFEAARLLSEMADLKLQAADQLRAPTPPLPVQVWTYAISSWPCSQHLH